MLRRVGRWISARIQCRRYCRRDGVVCAVPRARLEEGSILCSSGRLSCDADIAAAIPPTAELNKIRFVAAGIATTVAATIELDVSVKFIRCKSETFINRSRRPHYWSDPGQPSRNPDALQRCSFTGRWRLGNANVDRSHSSSGSAGCHEATLVREKLDHFTYRVDQRHSVWSAVLYTRPGKEHGTKSAAVVIDDTVK